VIAVSNLVDTVGSGIYFTAGVLYFTQAAHLPAGEVGRGLGIAVGHLAGRHSARVVRRARSHADLVGGQA
jgi:hypothetical protein